MRFAVLGLNGSILGTPVFNVLLTQWKAYGVGYRIRAFLWKIFCCWCVCWKSSRNSDSSSSDEQNSSSSGDIIAEKAEIRGNGRDTSSDSKPSSSCNTGNEMESTENGSVFDDQSSQLRTPAYSDAGIGVSMTYSMHWARHHTAPIREEQNRQNQIVVDLSRATDRLEMMVTEILWREHNHEAFGPAFLQLLDETRALLKKLRKRTDKFIAEQPSGDARTRVLHMSHNAIAGIEKFMEMLRQRALFPTTGRGKGKRSSVSSLV